MITLTNGFPQGPNGLIVPNGSISFQLNLDATVITAPYGFVSSDIPVVFQFNAAGQIQPNAPAVAAQLWSNAELTPQLSPTLLGTYYLVTFYDQNGARLNQTPMWWQFTGAAGSTVDISAMAPFSTVGGNVIYYPVLAVSPGGPDTAVQVNSGGSLYGDLGFTYNKTAQTVGGLYGLYVSATPGAGTFTPALSVIGVAGATSYFYTVVARKGIAEIAIGLVNTTTGNAVLTSGNYNALSWAAVPGATSYDIYRFTGLASPVGGFLANTVTLVYNDIGTTPVIIGAGAPGFPENGFLDVSNGLMVQNSNYQTLQTHFGDSLGSVNSAGLSLGADGAPPFGRNEFVTAGPGRLIDTVNMPVVSIVAGDGPNSALQAVSYVSNNLGVSGLDVNSLTAWMIFSLITDTDLGNGIQASGVANDCNITGFSQDYDHGTLTGGKLVAEVQSATVNTHVDAVVGVVGSVGVGCNNGFTTSVLHAAGVAGALTSLGSAVTAATITNGYNFKAGPLDQTGTAPPVFTNYYNYFADVPSNGTIAATNVFGFYAKSQAGVTPAATLAAAFYAEDQGNAAGAWALFTAGTTPSKFGGNVTIGKIIPSYNGVNTVGNGVGSILAKSTLTAQSAIISATTIYAVPAAGAGLYRINYRAAITTAATTSSVLGGTNGFQVVYTDLNDSVVKTSNPTTPVISSVNATGTTISGCLYANCKASTNLQYQFGWTSVGGTAMVYDLDVYVEFLG